MTVTDDTVEASCTSEESKTTQKITTFVNESMEAQEEVMAEQASLGDQLGSSESSNPPQGAQGLSTDTCLNFKPIEEGNGMLHINRSDDSTGPK